MLRSGVLALVAVILLAGCTAPLDPDELDDEIRALPGTSRSTAGARSTSR